MSVMSEASAWLEQASPDAEEIKQTIDNLAFQHSISGSEQRTELKAVIFHLCEHLGLDPNTVVLAADASAPAKPTFDVGPLVVDAEVVEEMPAIDRTKRFRELRELLERPF